MRRNSCGVAAIGALLLLAACGGGHRSTSRFSIPFVKYTLDNGLEVVLHEDHSDPIVAIATLVHVGSNREAPGKTGFAHFFEHMSFNDSENVPRGANRKLIGELGGTRNGGTWTDGTIYYEVVPQDAFEKLLWIDSDRLGYMINTVTEWALENEKQVVKNEKRQRVDNRPYGHTEVVIPGLLYPPDHPYHWPVIGSLEDLQAATLDDVRSFYDRYYGANNATLVIAGDIEIDETRRLVEKWFGEIRRGEIVEPLPPMPVTLERSVSVFHVDNFAKLPELTVVFPTVEQFHEDAYALDALGRILSSGKRAPLYEVIVEERQLAPNVRAWNDSSELAGRFTIRVRTGAGVDLDEARDAIDEAFERFETRGVPTKDLQRIKAEQETAFYRGIASVLGKAFRLATFNEYAGDPGYGTTEIERIQSVSRDDVMRVYERYLKDRPHVMTSFVPRGEQALALEDAIPARIVEERIVHGAEKTVQADPQAAFEKTPTTVDRREPPLGPPPVIDFPEIWAAETDNGIRVLGIEHDELPLVELRLRIEGGHLLCPAERAGAARLLADLMREGTQSKTPEELEDAIGVLGADLTVDADGEGIVISARGLARHYRTLLALTTEVLLEPRWDATEFERLKRAQLTRIRQREGDPRAIATNVLSRLLYGERHVNALPVDGTVETVGALTLDHLKTFYRESFSPSVAAFHVVGDVSRETVLDSLRPLGSRWPAKTVAFPEYELPVASGPPVVYFVDVPGAKQSVLMAGRLTLSGDDPDHNDLVYANNRLGAGSSARLFQLLRIEKGYTYGAGSWIRRTRQVAPFVASTSVRANVTLESLELLRDELRGYRASFTADDLVTTQNLLLKQATREFETLGDLLNVLEDISRFDLPLDYIERDRRELMELTLEDVHRTIETHIDESRMIYVVVGDAATQRERIERLGHGAPIMLDVHGNPVGA